MKFGIDMTYIRRFENKGNLAKRILSKKELEEYQVSTEKAIFLATHFAAKEAYMKANSCRHHCALSSIELFHEENGKPYVMVNGVCWDISITHEKDYVIAMVMEHEG